MRRAIVWGMALGRDVRRRGAWIRAIAVACCAVMAPGLQVVAAEAEEAAGVKTTPGAGSYAVVVSRATHADPAWRQAVEALVKKHRATLIVHDGEVNEVGPALAEVFPRHACFLARPEEANRPYVLAVHRLTRALDDDPYTDLFWGILTGYDASDALRIAKHDEPLVIRRGAAGTGLDLDAFEQGIWFSEGEKGAKTVKLPGEAGKKKCADDSTAEIVDMLNTFRPQLFLTSGHATPRDWQIGYSYPNGEFRCQDGQLFGLSLDKKRYPVNSPEPKVYLPAGNCLMGLIPDRQAMALAWIHTGGAYQMIGYVVSTFFGYGGWGTKDYFIGQGDRFTCNEAFIANNISLVHELETRFPKNARVNIDEYDIETDRTLIPRLAQKHQIREQDELGLLWDRDTLAFYGDPAWSAKMARLRPPAWKQVLTEKDGVFTLELTSESDGGWGSRPAIQFLPRRVKNARVLEGAEFKPVVADTFVLVPKSTPFEKGKTIRIVWKGE